MATPSVKGLLHSRGKQVNCGKDNLMSIIQVFGH